MEKRKMLEKKIRRYKLMDKHQEMVQHGQLEAARILLKLLRDGKVYLWLDEDSVAAEIICEDMGCYIHYDRRGYKAIAYL